MKIYNIILGLCFLFSSADLFAQLENEIDFEYNGITYTVVDATSRTCRTKRGTASKGSYNNVTGDLVLPETVYYSSTPLTLVEIGNWGFYRNYELTSVVIPETVTSIGWASFASCTKLEKITLPESLTSIDGSAFSSNYSLQSIKIPDNTTSIGVSAFSACENLKFVSLPSSLTRIENETFRGCESLSMIELPSSIESIGQNAFAATGLKTINIPSSLSIIEDEAFLGSQLEFIELPNTLTHIGSGAFAECKFEHIDWPESISAIESAVFRGCLKLKQITIPSSVTSIGRSAFMYCSELGSIIIPSSVSEIGSNAFWACINLSEIYNYALYPQAIDETVFMNVDYETCPLYVLEESLNDYQNDSYWKVFSQIIGVSGFRQSTILRYHDIDGQEVNSETITLNLPTPEPLEGHKFVGWKVLGGDLDDGIHIQALYSEDTSTSVDVIYDHNQNEDVKKVILHGQIFIIKGDKVYNMYGQEVN